MSNQKLAAGAAFPECNALALDGEVHDLRIPAGDADWRMIVVYRGKHCPICKKYLRQLNGLMGDLLKLRVDVVAVCADSPTQMHALADELDINVPLYGGLTLEQMQQLGLYISSPRNENETDHPFPEPGLFVINAAGELQIIDISNAPFARPEIQRVVDGIAFIRENDYPIRGTHDSE